ncbi:hypothetical protein LTR62_005981 [Meristemomyces frigidus]|uniref:NECAP PHear domain-containing protein n=1 Tax=Meristemomyces frigidus TaxID=1508187 RepID=A0AAN7TW35_9PEZI|nr:hypothetical protein LTR62_005981 [Meristemomyces frigidus]
MNRSSKMLDPATGRALPESDTSYQRILFSTQTVHVYGIPPLTSTKGFSASSWTSPIQPTAKQIFTARLRVIETTVNSDSSKIKVDIVLEDSNTGDLFAAAPYTTEAVVQQANDSSRFFAVRVQGEGGMKATLGIGFEDRSPAFDFSIALTEARKGLGWKGESGAAGVAGKGVKEQKMVDFSLKEGEKIHIQMPGDKAGSRIRPSASAATAVADSSDGSALFSIAPPPVGGKPDNFLSSTLPPASTTGKSAQELGFDDGEFGEFQ